MERPGDLKVGDQFVVVEDGGLFDKGTLIFLAVDDGTDCPYFSKVGNSNSMQRPYAVFFSRLQPYRTAVRTITLDGETFELHSLGTAGRLAAFEAESSGSTRTRPWVWGERVRHKDGREGIMTTVEPDEDGDVRWLADGEAGTSFDRATDLTPIDP